MPYWYHKYIYTIDIHNLFKSTYILHGRKFKHTPDNAHLFYIIVVHAYQYSSAVKK